jgi:hypothetical protein
MKTTDYTLTDRISDAWYMGTMVYPARLAAPAVIEWAAAVANLAMITGFRRLAIRAAIYAYDIADHDPADATWELHRQRMPWAWSSEGFRPSLALMAAGRWSV